MMKKYTIVYKNIGDNKIRFIDNLDTYVIVQAYEGYIYDCTNIDRLRQV